MLAADVRVDERHRERLDTRADEVADDRLDLCLVDRDDGVTLGVHALGCLARVRERRGRVRLDHDDPAREGAGGLGPRQVQDLLEALGRDQPDAGTLGLEHRVRRDGRPVQDVLELGDLDPRLVANAGDAVENAFGRVARRRRGLHTVLRAAGFVADEKEIGEGSPDVDPQPVRHPAPPSRR